MFSATKPAARCLEDETKKCKWCGRRFKPKEKNQGVVIPLGEAHHSLIKRKEYNM